MDDIRSNGKGVFYAKTVPLPLPPGLPRYILRMTDEEYRVCVGEHRPSAILLTPHQVSSETSKAFSATSAACVPMASGGGPGIEVAPDGPCACLPEDAIRMGTGVPIQMGRLTDGTLGGSGNFDGPVMRSVHPGLAHLAPVYRGSCGRLERMEMEAEWDANQTRLEKLTKWGYLEYTLGPQCAVCAALAPAAR